ncbi:hypothetical protein XENOCAPTIV_003740, partial [Xenoophorus captivus]
SAITVFPGCHFAIVQLFFMVFLKARLQAGGWKMVTHTTLHLRTSRLRQSILQHSSPEQSVQSGDSWIIDFSLLFFPFVSHSAVLSLFDRSLCG